MDEGLRWLHGLAAEVGAVVTGSLVIREGKTCVNRLVWMRPTAPSSTTTSAICSAWPASTSAMPVELRA